MKDTLYEQILTASLSVGLPVLSIDTSAKILAVIYVLGNNEYIVLSSKVQEDVKYIQKRFHIQGGEAPSPEILQPLKGYIKELEDMSQRHECPEWAKKLFKERYNIPLYY